MTAFKGKFEERGGTSAPEDAGDEDAMFSAMDNGNAATTGISLEDWFAGYRQIAQAVKAAMEANKQ